MTVIETERLILRPLTGDDFDDYAKPSLDLRRRAHRPPPHARRRLPGAARPHLRPARRRAGVTPGVRPAAHGLLTVVLFALTLLHSSP
ncbi:hypothetical protein [Nonomuraea zeae]|uniref:Uncharacterized protein n=1 Tax=Nonomuraea zeae TaxID=1642303 RepID=A0A5S4FRS8_9ACTN|nr:hypothetical protein [Nonomuraea zeae]TMR12079.1 hypothetical protein ETD85_58655 [Nonomuraea zeae]